LKRLTWVSFAVVAFLAACSRPSETSKSAPPPAATGPIVERPSPVKWNASTGGFELNGHPLKAIKLWTFDGSTEGFTPVGSKVTPAAGSGLSVVVADPTLRSPKGLNVAGGQYPLVLVRLTRTQAGALWDGALYYSTEGHPEGIGFFGKPVSGADPKVGETTTLVYDMSRQANGAPDWTQSVIDRIRLDLEDRPGGGFLIRQVAITDDPDPSGLAPTPTAPPAPAPAAAAAAPAKKP
jgi:hypothetical protein